MIDQIYITELIRAGDVFLIKFDCPSCQEPHLTSINEIICSKCGLSYLNSPFSIDRCNKRNLVAITKRYNRKKITKKIVLGLLKMQEYCCAYCDIYLRDSPYHVDHITPLAAGGTNNENNLAIACPTCNLKASSLVFPNLISKRLYLRSKRFTK